MIADLVPLLQSLVGSKVEIHIDLQHDLGLILLDEGELQRIIMNLVVNARDAVSRSGGIRIQSRRIDGARPGIDDTSHRAAIQFTVRDTGCGMTEQPLARIFEPFFTTKELGKGTGLGSATVYAIVTKAGGEISVESALDQGSEFRVVFPGVPDGTDGAASEYDPITGRRCVQSENEVSTDPVGLR